MSLRAIRVGFLTPLLLAAFALSLPAQSVDLDGLQADEELSWGVRAYHRGYFQDAIQSFQRSLSLRPDDATTRAWLGHAYFRSGLEAAALDEWRGVIERGAAGAYLDGLVERIELRRAIEPDAVATEPYVFSRQIDSTRAGVTLFRRPTSVLSRSDGTLLVVSLAGHEVAILDVNGNRVGRWAGGVTGFDAPYDIAESGGYYYLTEFGADRVSRLDANGFRTATFGSEGHTLLGPQYIASDGKGYLYVSDWGNRRIAKFDEDGAHILSFGESRASFPGFLRPTGVAAMNDRVYVADSGAAVVYVFDESGNYLETLGREGIGEIEGIDVFGDDELLIGAVDHVAVLNVAEDTIRVLSDLEGGGGRVVAAVKERNGDVVAVDFDRNALFMLTERPGLYTGIRAWVERIDAQNWPEVLVDVRVEDRNGTPIVGLRGSNFAPTEGGVAVEGKQLVYAADRDSSPAISLIVERVSGFEEFAAVTETVIRAVHEAVTPNGAIHLLLAGEQPRVDQPAGTGLNTLVERARSGGDFSPFDRFDTAVRLAAGELFRTRGRRSVTYLTRGRLSGQAFREYDITELAALLRNNGVVFDVLHVGDAPLDPDLMYLSEETGGGVYRPQEPRGMIPFVSEVTERPSGRYTLWYRSTRDGDFGRAMIPVEIEVLLGERSGRGESAYYSPLEF